MSTFALYQFVRKYSQILGLIALAFVIAFTQVTPASAQSGTYPLAGATYQAQNFSGVRLPAYDSTWTPDGRNWQPMLPSGPQRVPFTVSIEIMPGEYVGNAVACYIFLDEERNGRGSDNDLVVNHENGKSFSVRTSDGKAAWMLIECDGGTSSGYDIWAVSPSYSGAQSYQPQQPVYEQPGLPVYDFALPRWFTWIFTGTALVSIGIILSVMFVMLVTFVVWIWSIVVMWRIHWVWGIVALVTGIFFPFIGPIVWLTLNRFIVIWPTFGQPA